MGITRNNRSKRRATGGKKKHYRKARKYELGRQPTFTKIGERKITLVRKRGGSFKRRALRLDSGNFAWATEAIARKTRILNVSYNASSNELVRTNTLVKNCIIQVDATPFRTWYEQHYGVNLGKTRKQDPTKAGAKRPAPKKNEKRLVKKIKLPPRKLKDLQKLEARHKRKVALKKKEKAEAGKDKKKDEKTGKDSTTTTKSAGKTGKSDSTTTTKKEKKEGGEKKEKRVTDSERRKRSALRKRVAPVDVHLAEQFQGGRLYACVSTRPGQDGGADGYILEGKELEFYLKKLQKKKSGK